MEAASCSEFSGGLDVGSEGDGHESLVVSVDVLNHSRALHRFDLRDGNTEAPLLNIWRI